MKILLFPFAIIFWCITSLRNWFYDKNIFKSTEFDVPIISVGNLAVGGSGKTPMVEHLIKHLQPDYNIVVLSRGYGRKTTGFKWVQPEDSFSETGDEPLQIKLKYPEINVAVCEKRVDGVIQILSEKPNTNLILLDDAFQHRAIKPSINLILSEYSNPYFKDWIMPIGRLRECRKEINRADALIYTKCPDSYQEYSVVNLPTFYSKILYTKPVVQGEVFGFSGLANNTLFQEYLSQNYNLIGFKGFRDHYSFKLTDIESLIKDAKGAQLICTEKDFIKIKNLAGSEEILFITIENEIEGNEDFMMWLKDKIKIES
ncbi:MAG: tetraacyldisaccharide 4'-kinase [Bacteroidia bacterium]|nr:tetraacyldisaccharide 4'-kinase [Bacteroidia bacterium]NNJ56567.1 tetraacyldisaccharide 4'-kinase [Bacteroidia bacterium]